MSKRFFPIPLDQVCAAFSSKLLEKMENEAAA
jgi:hypothetical protein